MKGDRCVTNDQSHAFFIVYFSKELRRSVCLLLAKISFCSDIVAGLLRDRQHFDIIGALAHRSCGGLIGCHSGVGRWN